MWEFLEKMLEELPGVLVGVLITSLISLLTFIASAIIKVYKIKKSSKDIYATKDDITDLKYYVQTCGQDEDPCDYDEIKKGISIKRIRLLRYFINDVIKNDKDGRYFAVLGDSGMGKSVFLRKLYIKYNSKLKNKKNIKYFSLTNTKDLSELKNMNVDKKKKTILLLDSLDEDKYAIINYEKRSNEILDAVDGFYKIILTCRTQFFKDANSEPNETDQVEENSKNKMRNWKRIYISPFDDDDVITFLNKKFKYRKTKKYEAAELIEKIPNLVVRPMILGYIDLLLNGNDVPKNLCEIYEIIINEWYNREALKKEEKVKLKNVTENIAMYMFNKNVSFISLKEIEKFCNKDDIKIMDENIIRSKSLLNRYANGNYKFSHKSLFDFLITKIIFESYNCKLNRKKLHDLVYSNSSRTNLKFYRYFSIKYLEKGIEKRDLSYYHLSYMKLGHMNWINFDLDYISLYNAVLKKMTIQDSKFNNTNLREVEFEKVNIRNVDFYNSYMDNTKFTYCHLNKVNFIHLRMDYTRFVSSFIKSTNFNDVIFKRICFNKSTIDKFFDLDIILFDKNDFITVTHINGEIQIELV